MHYLALACDYDGTLARDGVVSTQTVDALEHVNRGYVRNDMQDAQGAIRDFQPALKLTPDNGIAHLGLAFSYLQVHRSREALEETESAEKLLGEAPPRQFIQALQERGVTPLVTGRVIVASLHPHEKTIVDVIAKLGLELQVIFNKGAVMVLPTGMNKATGLIAALQELKLSAHNVVGIGDAENDLSFLSLCECSVAVANAIPSLKEQADYTTKAENGDGVIELIEQLLADDLKTLDQRVGRQHTQPT